VFTFYQIIILLNNILGWMTLNVINDERVFILNGKWILSYKFNWLDFYLNKLYCIMIFVENDRIYMKLWLYIWDNAWNVVWFVY